MGKKPYQTLGFVEGIAGLGGGAIGIALGMRGEISFLILGIISLALGIFLMYSLSK